MRILLPLLLALPIAAAAAADRHPANDYPTATRAEYVFACMTANGGTQAALQQCSCVIDVIASILPYRDYQDAETVLRMRQLTGGYLAQTFHTETAKRMVHHLEEAQAEADVRCF